MALRNSLMAGILLAMTTAGLAPAATAATPDGSVVGHSQAAAQTGAREGPLASSTACSARAKYWTNKTKVFHFCQYKDGSDGYAEGWWVWIYR